MSKNAQFQKFINQKSNAAKKEQFRQEKKAAKKERAAAIEKRFEEKRKQKIEGAGATDAKSGPAVRITKADIRAQKAQPAKSPAGAKAPIPGRQRPAESDAQPARPSRQEQAPKAPRHPVSEGLPKEPKPTPAPRVRIPKPGSLEEKIQKQQLAAGILPTPPAAVAKPVAKTVVPGAPASDSRVAPVHAIRNTPDSDLMPLNKFIAHSGVCSRRDAAELVKQGEVKVNDQVVTEPGTKVSPRDTVTIKGKKLTPSRNLVYVLLNKPKDYITTLDDPEGRKTVLDLVKRATNERIYPVGRLDRNTSGVLLLTNDGDLAQILSHPKHEIKKIYEVHLDRPLTKADFEQLIQGLTLEDGFIMADAVGYVDTKDKSVIGIEIHSGRNRIVRRMFEFLGYDVRGLDRVMYAGLTKKNVQRGKWRFLTEKEIRILRHFNPQTKSPTKTKQPAIPKKQVKPVSKTGPKNPQR